MIAHARFETFRRITLAGQRVIIRLGAEVAVVQSQDVETVITRGVAIIHPAGGGFRRIARAGPSRPRLFALAFHRGVEAVDIHAQLEEEIFYPACEGKVDEDLLSEAYVEHDSAKVLIAEIEAGGPDDEFYDAKVKVLSEMIEHHVEEEEKRVEGMFAQARKAGLDMDALGEDRKSTRLNSSH